MATDPKIIAAIEAAATDLLPDIPEPDPADDGYDWMERLPGTGWHPIPGNRYGRQLGDWPYQIVCHHNDDERGLYGLAVYTERDLSVDGYWDRAERNRETDQYLADDD